MKQTIMRIASNALCVENACNLSGVVHSFSRDIAEIPQNGTDWRNNHPVCILYVQVICNIQGVYYDINFAKYSKAHQWCVNARDGKTESWDY